MRKGVWVRGFGLLAVLVVVGASCSSSDEAAPVTSPATAAATTAKPTTTSTTEPSTTSTTEPITTTSTLDLIDEDRLVYAAEDPASVEAEVETAYYWAWDASRLAGEIPDPLHPDIALTQAGQAAAITRRKAQELVDANEFVRFAPLEQHIVQGITMLSDSVALLNGCHLNDAEFYNQDEPDTIIASGLFTIEWSATLEFFEDEGRWKLTQLESPGNVEGIGGCAS